MENRWYQDEAAAASAESNAFSSIIGMPTGTGKSNVLASILKPYIKDGKRCLNLVHDKNIIQQNHDKLKLVFPAAPAGILSAGLRKNEADYPVIFGGIGTVANRLDILPDFDFMSIDECHRVPFGDQSQYAKVINHFRKLNRKLRIRSLTATPWRQIGGHLTNGPYFDEMAYDLNTIDYWNRLTDEEFLSPVISKGSDLEVDSKGLRKNRSTGDFMPEDLEKKWNDDALSISIMNEVCSLGYDRKRWLIFAVSIAHAESISGILNALGVEAKVLHSKLSQAEQKQILEDHKAGKIRAVVNVYMLTTGYDYPEIDLIVVARNINASSLWVQIVGRGTRVHPNKKNCLVLDYGGNTIRCGPVNDPIIPGPTGQKNKGGGQAPARQCPECKTISHISLKSCPVCGHVWPVQKKIVDQASTEKIVVKERNELDFMYVNKVKYTKHIKEGKPPSVKVTFAGSKGIINHFLLPEHSDTNKRIAKGFLKKFIKKDTELLCQVICKTDNIINDSSQFKKPTKVYFKIENGYRRAKKYEFA